MDKFILTKELGDAILTYLSRQPFIEVHELIALLQNLEKIEEDKEIKK